MKHLIILLAVSLMALSGCAHRGNSTGPQELRVLTYNIHHAEGNDGRLDLERIASVIQSVQPDLVALQEVDDRSSRVKGSAQAEELGRLTGMYAAFGKAMDFQGGGYGQAILSKWPIGESTVHQLPQNAGREPRIVFVTRIKTGAGEDLAFATTHLDHELEDVRQRQAATLNEVFSGIPTAILAGDFNATPQSGTINTMLAQWDDAASANAQPTIPAESPRRRIDYILLRPKGAWAVVEARVLEETVASDHRPVFAIIRRTN